MAIDLSGLPLALDSGGAPHESRRRAGIRREAAEAWLDGDDDAIGRMARETPDLAPDLDELRADLFGRRAADAAQEGRGTAEAALGDTLQRLAAAAGASDDPGRRRKHGMLARRMLDDHAGAGLLDPDQAEGLAGRYDTLLSEADAGRLSHTQPKLAKTLLADETLFPGLESEWRQRLLRVAEARSAAAGDDAAANAERAGAEDIASTLTRASRNRADLGRRLSAGEAGLGDIAAAEAAGDIDAHGGTLLRRRFEAVRHEATTKANGIARVEATLVAGGRLDPFSADDRAALDAHYLQTRKGWDEAGLSPEEVGAELADYITDAGCIPDEVCRRIGRIFRVGTPEERWQAARLIRTMEEREPALLGQIDPDDARDGLAIVALERAGYPAADAVARYQALVSENVSDPQAPRDLATVDRGQVEFGGSDHPLTPAQARDEPRRVSRRQFGLSQAATGILVKAS